MKRFGLAFLLFAGCGSGKPPADLPANIEKKFSEQTSCRYRFRTVLSTARIQRVSEGVAVCALPETLQIIYRTGMDGERYVRRTGGTIQLWDRCQETWIGAESCGDAVSSNGYQNLPLLLHTLASFKAGDVSEQNGERIVSIKSGAALSPFVPELNPNRDGGEFTAKITLGADGLPRAIELAAQLQDASVKVSSSIAVEEYNKERELTFPIKP